MMRLPPTAWLLFGLLAAGGVNGQTAGEKSGSGAAPAAKEPAAAPARAVMESQAQKQRETTLAAMQAAVDKQRASVAAALASFGGKTAANPAKSDGPAAEPFFLFPPLIPPAERAAAFALPEAPLPDVNCEPAPEAQIAPLVLDAAQREGLDPHLITAMIQQESAYRPCAVSNKGAQGLMQLMPDTSEAFAVKDPFDSRQNIDAGAKYFKQLLTRYAGDLAKALGAYNAGPDAVDQAGGVPPIPETTEYVNGILEKLRAPAPGAAPIVPPAPPTAGATPPPSAAAPNQ